MKTAYTDLDISITMDGAIFFVLNIVFEKFSRAMPSFTIFQTAGEPSISAARPLRSRPTRFI